MKKILLILFLCLGCFLCVLAQSQYDAYNINRAQEIETIADSLDFPATRLIAMYGSSILVTYETEKHYITHYYKYDKNDSSLNLIKIQKEKKKKKTLFYKIFNETGLMCRTQYISEDVINERLAFQIDSYSCCFYFAFYKNGIKVCESNQPITGLKNYEIIDYNPLNTECFTLLVRLINLNNK